MRALLWVLLCLALCPQAEAHQPPSWVPVAYGKLSATLPIIRLDDKDRMPGARATFGLEWTKLGSRYFVTAEYHRNFEQLSGGRVWPWLDAVEVGVGWYFLDPES